MENQQPMTSEPKNEEKKGFKKYLSLGFELLKIFLLALVIVVPIRYFLFQPFIVKGDSMVPNFHSGDYLIVDEISYKMTGLQRGDVIVFDYPNDVTQRFIKRVIGLPGETVSFDSGKVEVTKADGTTITLDETYLPTDLKTDGAGSVVVTPGHYFVMGDNRPYSYDSRIWGLVPTSDLIGRPVLRLFPFNALSDIKTPKY